MLDSHLEHHIYAIGNTGSGKSKGDEWMARPYASPFAPGLFLIDFHGTLYRAMVEYLSYIRPRKKVVLIDPSSAEYALPLDFFFKRNPHRMFDLLLKAWKMEDQTSTPYLAETGRAFFSYCVDSGQPLTNAFELLNKANKELRERETLFVKDPRMRQTWERLNGYGPAEWNVAVGTLHRKISGLLFNPGILRFFCLDSGHISIADLIRQRAIVLVNLSRDEMNLDDESTRIFGTLLIAEIFNAAMQNAEKPIPCRLMIDEFQLCLTRDLAAMLAELRKTGMFVTLSHQYISQLLADPNLFESILTNCTIKAIFGGIPFEAAKLFAKEIRLDEINRPWIKREIWSTKVLGQEEREKEIVAKGRHSGFAASAFNGLTNADGEPIEATGLTDMASGGESETITKTTILKNIFGKELSNVQEYPFDEKVSIIAQQLIYQPQRHCYLKFPGKDAFQFVIPEVKGYGHNKQRVAEFIHKVHEANGAIPGPEADRLILESRQRFISQSSTPLLNADPDIRPVSRKRKRQ